MEAPVIEEVEPKEEEALHPLPVIDVASYQ